MTTNNCDDQALPARESLAKRVDLAGYVLLTNVPMALSGLSDQVRAAYVAITFHSELLDARAWQERQLKYAEGCDGLAGGLEKLPS